MAMMVNEDALDDDPIRWIDDNHQHPFAPDEAEFTHKNLSNWIKHCGTLSSSPKVDDAK
jgi:hypothetical protein